MASSSASARRRGVNVSRRSEARKGHRRHPEDDPGVARSSQAAVRRARPDPGRQLTGANQDVRRRPGKRQTIRIGTSLPRAGSIPARVQPSYAHSRGVEDPAQLAPTASQRTRTQHESERGRRVGVQRLANTRILVTGVGSSCAAGRVRVEATTEDIPHPRRSRNGGRLSTTGH